MVISVFLGLFVFMLIVNQHTPVTSDSVPMLTQFFNYIALSTFLALFATAFILHLNDVPSGVTVPWHFQRIRDCIAVVLCMKKTQPRKKVELNMQEILLKETSRNSLRQPEFSSQAAAILRSTVEQKILNELQKISRHFEEENNGSEQVEDWHYTLKLFDTSFFVIFFMIFLGLFFLCFFVLLIK